jgi:MinD-like ATPase involved in chromosome partitioning or flagellar assembly
MKIACVDKSPSDRLKLQQCIEEKFESCRDSVGHVRYLECHPCSIQELSFTAAPRAIIVGPQFSQDEALCQCTEIKEKFPEVPLFILRRSEQVSLRVLKRFAPLVEDVFSTDDSAVRIIYKLTAELNAERRASGGKLVTLSGVKGGVGCTSIAVALAHAFENNGSRAVLLDLSPHSSIATYLLSQRWQSAELSLHLKEHLKPNRQILENSLTSSPNGLTLFLPPGGSQGVREHWIRDEARLEFTGEIVELLRDTFDVIIADLGTTEGILPFALLSRAETRILVSSNEPASAHLLGAALHTLSDLPGSTRTLVTISCFASSRLKATDIEMFVRANNDYSCRFVELPFDASGGNWVGTGNTFYSECRPSTRKTFNIMLRDILSSSEFLVDRLTGVVEKTPRLNDPSLMSRLLSKLPGKRWHGNSSRSSAAPALLAPPVPAFPKLRPKEPDRIEKSIDEALHLYVSPPKRLPAMRSTFDN